MSTKPLTTSRDSLRLDPLHRLGIVSLVAGFLGLLTIVYTMVHFVRDRDSAEPWMLAVGCCFLFGAVAGSLIQGVLKSHGARIAALEKLAAIGANVQTNGMET
jgi:hypothetical protein